MKKLVLGLVFMVSFMVFGGMTAFAAEADANSSLPYIVKEGTIYYESAYDFGSGRMGIVSSENEYTTDPCYARINGYAFLDENGNVIKSDYYEDIDDIIMPLSPPNIVTSLEELISALEEEAGITAIWVHFESSFYRNGWVDFDNIILNDVEHILVAEEEIKEQHAEQEPEEVVEHIEQEIKKDEQKTTIVIDFSGSMYDNQKEVVQLLTTLDFNDYTTIIAFAEDYQVITKEQLASGDFYVGGGTHMFKALNALDSIGTDSLIIISDLATHDLIYEDNVELKPNSRLKSVVIYDPDDGDEDSIVDEVLKPTWSQATVSRVRIR